MKIEIDFDNKIITVKDSATLGELVDKLKELKLDWKEYRLQSEVNWYPYYQQPWIYQPYIQPYYPFPISPTVSYASRESTSCNAIYDNDAQLTFNN